MKLLALVLVIYLNFIVNCNALRVKDAMYELLHGVAPCFRRMNGTHQFGCSSKRGGTTGVVHFVVHEEDLNAVIYIKNSLEYVPVVPDNLFNGSLVLQFENLAHISGVIVYKANNTLTHYTHEDQCPNRYSNADGTCSKPWNRFGTNLLHRDIRFPIFYIDNWRDIDKIRDCFRRFNNYSFETHDERALCALELNSFMFAAKDTETCIRRSNSKMNINPIKFCDPLGDRNIWASLFPVGTSNLIDFKPNPALKYIIVAARIDTTSMFSELTPGAQNPITSLVTLLSTAQLLKKMLPNYDNYDKNVLFVIFNGESYDYIGSQRFLYDMERHKFPVDNITTDSEKIESISLDDIALYIELNQLSKSDSLHAHHYVNNNEEIRNFLDSLNSATRLHEETSGILPPASLQTFIKHNRTFPGIIIADHDGNSYTNGFYNSIYDNAEHIGFNHTEIGPDSVQNHVGRVTTAIASSLYKVITGQTYNGTEKMDATIVDELFHCYLENANCTIHRAVARQFFSNHPFNLYVGVPRSANSIVDLVRLTLAWFIGDKYTESTCPYNVTSNVFRFYNMSESIDNLDKTRCFRACLNMTEAVSPAFLIDDYDWRSGEYSTWSESVWFELSVRIFVQPTRQHELTVFGAGITVFILSTLITSFMHRKSTVLFDNNGVVSPTVC